MTEKIGLFGGTFDPIHQGHVHMALAFAAELRLDSVILIPAGEPYHKDRPRTAARHRLAMVEAAIAAHPQLAVSDCDMVRTGATYTVDTVQIFRQLFPQAQLWWLLGMDSLLQLHTWRHWQTLVRHANIAVAARDGGGLNQVDAALRPWLPEALAKTAAQPDGPDGGRLYLLQAAPYAASATAIRAALAGGAPAVQVADLPSVVAAYITRHALYAG